MKKNIFKICLSFVFFSVIFAACSAMGEPVDDFVKKNAPSGSSPSPAVKTPEFKMSSFYSQNDCLNYVDSSDKTLFMMIPVSTERFDFSISVNNGSGNLKCFFVISCNNGNGYHWENEINESGKFNFSFMKISEFASVYKSAEIYMKDMDSGKVLDTWNVKMNFPSKTIEATLRDVHFSSDTDYYFSPEFDLSNIEDSSYFFSHTFNIVNEYNFPLGVVVSDYDEDPDVSAALQNLFIDENFIDFNSDFTKLTLRFNNKLIKTIRDTVGTDSPYEFTVTPEVSPKWNTGFGDLKFTIFMNSSSSSIVEKL